MNVFNFIQAKMNSSCSFGHAQANAQNRRNLHHAKKEIEKLLDEQKKHQTVNDHEKKS